MIQANGLTKRYAQNVAVDGVTFTVEKGQIVGFLGPNGAGKTTTMRMLTGYMPPSAGTASVAGFDVVEKPLEVKKRIGYLPETPPVYPDMEVGEYLDFVAHLKGLPAAECRKKAEYAAERCQVKNVWGKLISKLSKGYRQRVGLAQAIIHNPEVLILDEPTSGFDPKQILETRDLIRSLAGDHTIVLSTHILQEVEAMCESLIIINQGRIAASGTIDELTHRDGTILEASGVGAETLRETFAQVPGVSAVTLTEDGEKLSFSITTPGADLRAVLARTALDKGANLLKLDTANINLHELFLTLTAPAVVPAAPAVETEEETAA
ncbi:MAG: ATP-binding cassette domain-containing protein [Bryobacter sp.]|nr:ATP-binding cassette domain-containing protein [Bryobacter sp.]